MGLFRKYLLEPAFEGPTEEEVPFHSELENPKMPEERFSERDEVRKDAIQDNSEPTNSLISKRLEEQSNEIKSLGQIIQGARMAWDKMQEELTGIRELMSRDQAVLGLLEARLQMHGREIESIGYAQAKLAGVVAELPKTLRNQMEGSEHLEQLKALISKMSEGEDKQKILMSTAQAARSAFMRVQDELRSIEAVMSARDQAVLSLLDAHLEKTQAQQLEQRIEDIRRVQVELAGAVEQLPSTVAQLIDSSEYSERLKTLVTSSLSDESQAEGLMETLRGTMSSWVRMQQEMNEIRDLVIARDQSAALKEVSARIRAIEERQERLAGALLELPATLRRDLEGAISELPVGFQRDPDSAGQTERIVALLSSALAEKAQERTFLLNTVEGARSAFFKVQEAVYEIQEHLAARDKEVLELVDSRIEQMQTSQVDARIADAREFQGKLADALSELTTALRREIEEAAAAVSERVSKEALEFLQLVRSLPRGTFTELTDASTTAARHPFTVREGQEDEGSGYLTDLRLRLSNQLSVTPNSAGSTPLLEPVGQRGTTERKRPASRGNKSPAASPASRRKKLSGEPASKSTRTESRRNRGI